MQERSVFLSGASDLMASVCDFKQFVSAQQSGVWLGLASSPNSTGGKACLGQIIKRGDDYLRTLRIQGAKSAVRAAHKRSRHISSGWGN